MAEYGIASGLWDDSELRALPAEWTGIDVLGDLVFALDSQRTMDNAYYEMLATDRARLAKLLAPSGSAPFVKVMAAIFRALPRGSVRIDQVEYNRIIDTDLQDIDAVHSAINPRFSRSINRSRKIVGVTEFCTSTVALTNANTTYKAAATHTHIQRLVLQCALERYRIEHGAFPASLDELVPGFLERIPRDPMDGQPLRYRRADAGGCLVWSVGPNRIDDGGKPYDRPDRRWEGPDWVSVLPSIGTK